MRELSYGTIHLPLLSVNVKNILQGCTPMVVNKLATTVCEWP